MYTTPDVAVETAEARAKAPFTITSLANTVWVSARMAPRVRAVAVKNSKASLRMGCNLRQIWARVCQSLRGEVSRGMLALCLLVAPAHAKDLTAIELVLALDSSASVDGKEFQLQIQGIAEAFRDPEVLLAVKNLQPFGVAIAVTQWGAAGETREVVPFTLIESERDAKAFGFRVNLIRRWIRASETSIATGINDARELIERNEFEGQRKVIDVSGDGQDNSDISLVNARDLAKASGITINGLPISAEDKTLADYYEANVITGADSFIEPADGFEDFARAIKEKLLRELRPLGS
jgi:hypothetical protein